MAARGSWGKSVLPVLVAIVTAVAAAPAPVTGDQVAKLLSGQRAVRTAAVTITQATNGQVVKGTGDYDFRSETGAFRSMTGQRALELVDHGQLLITAAAAQHDLGDPMGNRAPPPAKPWVSLPAPSLADPMAVILFALPVLPPPVHLAQALQRQVESVSSMGPVQLAGVPTHEYRLILGLGDLAKFVAGSRGTVDVLGPRQPVLIWVDRDNRLAQNLYLGRLQPGHPRADQPALC